MGLSTGAERGRSRVAVVGAGYMATEHVRAFRAAGAEVVGVHSRTRARAEALAAEHGVAHVCDSIDELRERAGAEVLVVAVPELEARAVAEAAFAHPWLILLEKPAGYDLADAEAIARAARERHARAFVALNRRFYSSTRAAYRDLESDPGRRFVQALDQQDPVAALDAGQPPAVVENWHFANSVHLVDFLRLLGRGAVTRVEPVIPRGEGRGVVVSRVDFESGDIGMYEGIWDGPGPWAVFASTAMRRWEVRPLEQASVQFRGERRLQPVASHPWDSELKPGLRALAEATLASAAGLPSGLPTLEDALATMRLVQAVFSDGPTDFAPGAAPPALSPLEPAGPLAGGSIDVR